MTHKAPSGTRTNEEVLEGRELICCCCSFGFCYLGVFVLFFSVFVSLFWFGFVIFNFHLEGCYRRKNMERLELGRIGVHAVKLPKIQ